MFSYTLLLHIPLACWWLLLLAALLPLLLGILIGWLLRSGLLTRIKELEVENKENHDRWISMEKDHMTLRYDHDELQKSYNQAKASLRSCEADTMVLRGKLEQAMHHQEQAAQGTAYGSSGMNYGILFQPDNLQIIEGIGPKVEEVLKNAGLKNWSDLSGKSADTLLDLLANAGPAYKMMNPSSWPQQAKLAAENRWDKLIEFQKFLDTGRDDKGDMETPSKLEQMAMRILGFSNNPEDLKIVEGIGPKIEELLKNAGVKTWSELAASTSETLQNILNQAGDNYKLADPGTWPEQAKLAVEGRWQELKDLQESLQGGKK